MGICALDISKGSRITYATGNVLTVAIVEKIASDGLLVLDNSRTILAESVRCVSRSR